MVNDQINQKENKTESNTILDIGHKCKIRRKDGSETRGEEGFEENEERRR